MANGQKHHSRRCVATYAAAWIAAMAAVALGIHVIVSLPW